MKNNNIIMDSYIFSYNYQSITMRQVRNSKQQRGNNNG